MDVSPKPISQHRLDKLAGFLARVQFPDRFGPRFELRNVDYTSPTDAVAELLDSRSGADGWDWGIATTTDSWAHSAKLYISAHLADLVSDVPLGRGAVAIKATNQSTHTSYPPFILFADGTTTPLRVADERALDADSELLTVGLYDFLDQIGVSEATSWWGGTTGGWAVDLDAGEIFPVLGSPAGDILHPVTSRPGVVLSVSGYRRKVGRGVWRFQASTDRGGTWSRTDIRLPLGRKKLWRYADITAQAIGPEHLQALAMADAPEDMPLYLKELWLTDDEKAFRRVPLPWDRLKFGGMAFASDGALLLAEVLGPDTYCDALVCNRAARIWRIPPGGTEPRLVPDAPELYGAFWNVGIHSTGGVIVARTGLRSIAVSRGGYRWTEVRPGW